jgi:poly-beta-1,6-N-acetyl-D-glucosamine synthase
MLIASLLILLYVWVAYPFGLYFLSLFVMGKRDNSRFEMASVTVVIAACNEENSIKERISNIYDTNYPVDLIHVMVVSDGSTDNTVKIVQDLRTSHENLQVICIDKQSGRANAHNVSAENCLTEFMVFTDAETRFDKFTLISLLSPFKNSKVGFVSGELNYFNAGDNKLTQSVDLYWIFERFLRRLESLLGVFAFGTGACCAVRRSFYKEIPPTGDVDFTLPLDVILKGYSCVYQSSALAWDEMPDTNDSEFKARVRMTSKNFHGTVTRWGIMGVILHPVYTWVILSHKIGRWLTPFFMLSVLIFSLLDFPSDLSLVLLLMQSAFYFLAILGFLRVNVPLASSISNFCLANVGFFIGTVNALLGRVKKKYTPINKL